MADDYGLETQKHQDFVASLLQEIADQLVRRAETHDASKLESPEREIFEEFTPRLKDLTYGSEEYKACLKEMRPALEHHYRHNRHHPEFFPGGVDDMNLIDLVEMFYDWVAASKRHTNGNIFESIRVSVERFGISDQLAHVLANTVGVFRESGLV